MRRLDYESFIKEKKKFVGLKAILGFKRGIRIRKRDKFSTRALMLMDKRRWDNLVKTKKLIIKNSRLFILKG